MIHALFRIEILSKNIVTCNYQALVLTIDNITDTTDKWYKFVLEQLLASLVSVNNDWGATSELSEPAEKKIILEMWLDYDSTKIYHIILLHLQPFKI